MTERTFVTDLPGRPYDRRSRIDWPGILEDCQRHPGKWTQFHLLGPKTMAHYHSLRAHALGLDFATRKVDGKTALYARWPK